MIGMIGMGGGWRLEGGELGDDWDDLDGWMDETGTTHRKSLCLCGFV